MCKRAYPLSIYRQSAAKTHHSGKITVCPTEETTYSTPNVQGSSWAWALISGGTIVFQDKNTIRVRWNNQPSTGAHKLTVTETNRQGCSKTVELSVFIKTVALVCLNNISIALNNTCQTSLSVADLLAGKPIGADEMRVQILSGGVILEEGIGAIVIDGQTKTGINYDFIGKNFTYRVIEPCSNNTCSGSIRFEDFAPPMLQCPADITLSCAQVPTGGTPLPSDSGSPSVTDCSLPAKVSYSDQIFETPCASPFTALPTGFPAGKTLPTTGDVVKIIVRSFSVADKWNNTSGCQQVIFVRKVLWRK
ncbi:MAG: hypothetical protein HC817_02345 [Saprospiraceae bacterium]|nr:hypothetical protein [Saprospiraceae bacterium]